MRNRIASALKRRVLRWRDCLRDRRACRLGAQAELGQVLHFVQADPELETDWLADLPPEAPAPPRHALRLLAAGLAGSALVALAIYWSAPWVPALSGLLREWAVLSRAQQETPPVEAPARHFLPGEARVAEYYPPVLPQGLVWAGPPQPVEALPANPAPVEIPAPAEPLPLASDAPAAEAIGATETEYAAAQGVGLRLIECARHFAAQRLMRGKEGNALSCYREVLAESPGNAQALAGIQAIVDRYASRAERAIAQGDRQAALRHLESLRNIDPAQPALAVLQARLDSALPPAPPPPPLPVNPPAPPILRETQKTSTVCRHCDCSELLSRLSIGIIPLNAEERAFLQTCR